MSKRRKGRDFHLPNFPMNNNGHKPQRNYSVAIVGTHPLTRDKAPFHDLSTDIWVFNGQTIMDWCPRANVVFDIHPSEDIYRRSQEDKSFGEWLKSEKGIPYYTPYPVDDCPNNVVYPVDVISEHLLKNFTRSDKPNQYFTSGPCYAIAMAIHLGYKEIGIYGVEMENNTEYIYQRDGIGLWLGIAAGRGVKVILPEQSMIFYAPLYGYEMDATKIDREAFEQRASELEQLMEKTHSEYNLARGRLDAKQEEFIKAQQNGATVEVIQKLAEEYENVQHAYEQSIANHAFVNGQFVDCRSWQARVEKVMEFNGKAQEVLGMNDKKWVRMADKLELSGRTLPNE